MSKFCRVCGKPILTRRKFCGRACYAASGGHVEQPPPSPATIRRRAAAIRAEWDDDTWVARATVWAVPWRVPTGTVARDCLTREEERGVAYSGGGGDV
jgi:hypothetical protein